LLWKLQEMGAIPRLLLSNGTGESDSLNTTRRLCGLFLDKNNAHSRYLRGQVLLHMGHEKEGREELAVATRMLNNQRAARHKELEGETVPSPELAREPQ
jgi:hypothetical protein